jgi:hypothetical protein
MSLPVALPERLGSQDSDFASKFEHDDPFHCVIKFAELTACGTLLNQSFADRFPLTLGIFKTLFTNNSDVNNRFLAIWNTNPARAISDNKWLPTAVFSLEIKPVPYVNFPPYLQCWIIPDDHNKNRYYQPYEFDTVKDEDFWEAYSARQFGADCNSLPCSIKYCQLCNIFTTVKFGLHPYEPIVHRWFSQSYINGWKSSEADKKLEPLPKMSVRSHMF